TVLKQKKKACRGGVRRRFERAAEALNSGVGIIVLADTIVNHRTAGPQDGLRSHLIGKPQPRSEAVLPDVLQSIVAAAARAGAGKFEGPGKPSSARIGQRGIEVAVLLVSLQARKRKVVAYPHVQGQPVVDLDVVLEIPGIVLEYEVDVGAVVEHAVGGEPQQECRIAGAGCAADARVSCGGRAGGSNRAHRDGADAIVAVNAPIVDARELESELHAV